MLIKRAVSVSTNQFLPKKGNILSPSLDFKMEKRKSPHTFFHNLSNNHYRAKKNLLSFQRCQKLSPKKTSRILICSSPPESQCSRTPKATAGMLIPFLWALLEGSLGSKVLGTSRPVAALGGFRSRGGTGDCSQ